jgi:23S rRNA (uridine2552-2'-O)-methyltransferase
VADFLTDEGLAELRRALGGREVDLVLSDLAPNISGNRAIDQPRSMALVEGAVDFAERVLKTGGAFLAKVFQGEGQAELEQALRRNFGTVKRFKPKASRRESREIYVLASDYRMV